MTQNVNVKKIWDKIRLLKFKLHNNDVLDKKSKLRNLFEKENKCACMPCYLDSNRDLENIIIIRN